ncbi:GntR family transcriptional regulator [Arthrobacter sp. EH-1B-1]|uniref:GntR family transcriptional regulator n=1 Tax=Arthrobacter vasquezii TaxID=2977629 RepID=A0ABT6CU54_9MICC|nr:GntR family transcriptional regulator [Arthrobacter vasquezii]MDF9277597.1 GntR family transcriptional regulator [Arthrobacter vasquezii]
MGTRSHDVLRDLRAKITTGKIPPGSHLTERDLCAEYGVSRTPIRSALRKLADEGLVVISPHRGVFVAEWTNADAAEVMSIRALLESHAAGLAARNRSESQIETLNQLCDRMEVLVDEQPDGYRAEVAELNHELHLLILEAAASPRLFNIVKDLALAPLMSGSFQYYSHAQLHRSLQDHRLVADAITKGDELRARVLMEGHLRNAYAALTSR